MNFRFNNRFVSLALVGVLALSVLFGCSTNTEVSDDIFGVYYISADRVSLQKQKFDLDEDTVSDEIDELIHQLSSTKEEMNVICPISDDVVVTDYELVEGELILHFNREYGNIESTREALTRAAIAKTMLQLDEVDSVSFYIANEPVKDASGNVVGKMTEDSFLDDFGEKEEALESDTFVLYYASEDGQSLVRKTRLIHFNNTVSSEAVVLNYLTKSPDTEDEVKPVLSPSVKVFSVATKEGTCYVKLDSSFLSQNENISTEVAVYGIVNSLTELDNVSKVEISIESSDGSVFPKTDNVSGLYEQNTSLVK